MQGKHIGKTNCMGRGLVTILSKKCNESRKEGGGFCNFWKTDSIIYF